jgi:hypothetical protein
MRVRSALAAAGIAVVAAAGIALPAQAASWKPYGLYGSMRACIDAGQQYVRENFDAYSCRTEPGGYRLWLK